MHEVKTKVVIVNIPPFVTMLPAPHRCGINHIAYSRGPVAVGRRWYAVRRKRLAQCRPLAPRTVESICTMFSRLFPRLIRFAVPAVGAALTACASGPGAAPGGGDGPLTIGRQGSFFVGGRDVHSSTLSLLPAYPAAGTVTVEQMYVRYQEPVSPSRVPLVLVHGCCLTGNLWA